MNEKGLDKQLRNVPRLQQALKQRPEQYWIDRGEKMALKLFHEMARRVPAYQDFLTKHGIKHQSIKTIKDFRTVPTIDKDNYLRQYPREALCWDGTFNENQWIISATSGSTGEPFYFPRNDAQDDFYAVTAELYMRENFDIQNKKTLYVDAFAMGAWIGGIFTYDAIRRVARNGKYNLSIITPGINVPEVIKGISSLGRNFDQVIIGCYPPILKDIIDVGIQQGVNWKDYNLGVVFSAEGFNEDFRDYIVKFGKLSNTYTSTLNHYGTVDLGTMSHETPASILVRRQAIKNQKLFTELFDGVRKLPTFTQYVPEMFYFEEQDGRVICSSYSGLPLVRYDLKDNGGVLTLKQVEDAYKAVGRNFNHLMHKTCLEHTLWNLPFVYLYERSDFSVMWSGATIYVEEIKKPLISKPFHSQITGKFTMEIVTDAHLDNKLLLHIELKAGAKARDTLGDEISDAVIAALLKENSEYHVLYSAHKFRMQPIIKLWPNGHADHFAGLGKQRWTKK